MSFELHPAAQAEHNAQITYYENQSPGLGQRHHAAIMAAINKACANPGIYRHLGNVGLRKIAVSGFPHSSRTAPYLITSRAAICLFLLSLANLINAANPLLGTTASNNGKHEYEYMSLRNEC